jgi:hypothetical protein
MKISVRLVLALLALMGGFLFFSLAGCSSAPETPTKIVEIIADDTLKYSVTAFNVKTWSKSVRHPNE